MKSFHPFRKGEKLTLPEIYSNLNSVDYLQEIVNAMPYPVLVLNNKREILFSNQQAINKLKAKDLSDFFGKKPGDALNCVNAYESGLGCGNTENCQVCGAYKSIQKSQKEKIQVINDFRTIAKEDESFEFLNFEVTATPVTIRNQEFTVFTMQDNTALKWKEMMERLFFHDVLNIAGNIKNFASLIEKSSDEEMKKKMIKMVEELSSELLNEIHVQRSISMAEEGEFLPQLARINSVELLSLTGKQFQNYLNKNVQINIDKNSVDIDFESDRGILSRILINMTKNAIESTSPGDSIHIGVFLENEKLIYRVNNPGLIPEKVRAQIFHKGFSTKSKGRGYGTYSMKLLGEKYLKAKVYFKSEEPEGTSFFLELSAPDEKSTSILIPSPQQ